MKRVITLALAVALCLSLSACGLFQKEPSPEAPTKEQTSDDALVEWIFSDQAMQGVEHEGYYIKADTATEDQVLLAAGMQTYIMSAAPVEGYQHTYPALLYFSISDENGDWYCPASAYFPCKNPGEDIHYNGSNYAKSYFGRLRVSVELNTGRVDEDTLSELAAAHGWEDMDDQQLHLLYVLNKVIEGLGFSIEDENIQAICGDTGAFAQCEVETEKGQEAILIHTHVMRQGVEGEYAISTILVSGITGADHEESLTEEEYSALQEIMTVYELYEWYE